MEHSEVLRGVNTQNREAQRSRLGECQFASYQFPITSPRLEDRSLSSR